MTTNFLIDYLTKRNQSIDYKQFDESYLNTLYLLSLEIEKLSDESVIYCQFEKDAEYLCSLVADLGFKWKNGISFKDNGWRMFKEYSGYNFRKGILVYTMFKSEKTIYAKDFIEKISK